MWVDSNAYSWEGLCRSYCFMVARVGILFIWTKKGLLERCLYIENDFRVLDHVCRQCNMTGFL